MPWPVAQMIGAGIGYIAYALASRYRALTWEHLQQAFGSSLSVKTRHRIARRVFMQLGKTVTEWFLIDRASAAAIRRRVDVHGVNNLHEALAKGRGVIGITAHAGNWELLPMTIASLGFQGGVLARPLRYPEYEQFLWSMRQRQGVTTYYRGALREVAALLRANQIVGILPDQDMDSLDGVFVEFFGRSTYTPVGPAALSLLTGAPIVPCFIARTGRRFRVIIEEPIHVERSGDRAADLARLTQAWSRAVESHIRCYPDQWVWMHRRWKTQPAAAPANGDGRPTLRGSVPHAASR